MPVLSKGVSCPTCGCTCRGNTDANKNMVKDSSSRKQGASFFEPQAQSTPDIKTQSQSSLSERKQAGRKKIIKARLVKDCESSSDNGDNETLDTMDSLIDKSLQEKCTINDDFTLASSSDSDENPPWLQKSVGSQDNSFKAPTSKSPLRWGSKLDVSKTIYNEYMDVGGVTDIDFNQVAVRIVDILNTNTGGDIYIGVDDDQVVLGVMSSRQQRDRIRQELDRICSQKINPNVTPKNVSIDFLKVLSKCSEDLHVIKISVKVTEITKMIKFSLRKAR